MKELQFEGKTRSGRKLFGVFTPTSATEGEVMRELFRRHCQAHDDIQSALPLGSWRLVEADYVARIAKLVENSGARHTVRWKHGQPMLNTRFDVATEEAKKKTALITFEQLQEASK